VTRVVVIGAGSWGSAIAIHLSRAGLDVALWGRDRERVAALDARRSNERYLPGIPFPSRLRVTADPPSAEVAVVAVPTQHIRPTLAGLRPAFADAVWVSVSKGIEIDTLLLPTDILADAAGAARRVVLSGPSHAIEVARGLPASLVAAGENAEEARWIQSLFMGPSLRVYTSGDRLGVEIAGALKNVIAVAAGICDGLELGDNAKAALIVRGAVEISRFGVALGARPETFHGLAGTGDLIVTCTSRHGRNLRAGREIGAGKPLEEVLRGMNQVAEGVWTAKAVLPWARKLGVEMPICREVYRILYESRPAAEAVRELMGRTPKNEF
jgi:glycerol-3-phosphate dehydrogenase (NAD(P)+)